MPTHQPEEVLYVQPQAVCLDSSFWEGFDHYMEQPTPITTYNVDSRDETFGQYLLDQQ